MASNTAAEDTEDKEFKEFCELKGRGTTLVTAGQSGAGKSTLVKNLLGFSDQDAEAPISAHSAESVTAEVKCHTNTINGVDVVIVDTPGLAVASEGDELKILAQLSESTKGKADMLLYCVSMAPSSKVGPIDRKIINLLTTAFTQNIWERAILVLTSADTVKERHQKNKAKYPPVGKVMENYAKAFEKLLPTSTDHRMTVRPVLKDEGIGTRSAKEMAAVPASETPDEEILPHMKWNKCIYDEVLKKCKLDAVPAILKVLEVSRTEIWVMTGVGGVAGVIAGASAGLPFLGVGAIPGAIGGMICGTSGYYIGQYRFKNTDAAKRAQIHEEIEKLRKAKTKNTGKRDTQKDK